MNKLAKISLTAMAVAPLMFAATAQADVNGNTWYVGAKTGWAKFDTQAHNIVGSADLNADAIDEEDDAWAGSVFGGYQINNWLAIEGGYNYLGHDKYTLRDDVQRETKVENLELGLKADWYFADDWNVFGKVGGTYNFVDPDGFMNADNGSLMLGTGVEYRLSNSMKLRTEYQWFQDVGDDSTNDIGTRYDRQGDVHYLSMGLVYMFGQQEEIVPVPVPAPVVEEVIEEPAISISTTNFGFDQSAFPAGEEYQLDPVVDRLNTNPEESANIVGFTDSTGPAEYNQKLSEKRAESVAQTLETKGIERTRMNVSGEGENNPVADNSTREGREQNRRVEVTFQ